jgi:hypothetical protein
MQTKNKNDTKIPFYPSQNGNHQENKQQQKLGKDVG